MTTISDYYCEETTECLNLKMDENKLCVEEKDSSSPSSSSQPNISPLHKNKSALGRVFHPPKLER